MDPNETDFLDAMMQTPTAPPSEADEPAAASAPEATGEIEAPPPAEPVAAPPIAATPAADPATPPETVPIAAMLDERKKRQALERQLSALQQQPQAPPSFYQDPERYVGEVVTQAQQTMQGQMYAALEYAAQQQFPDYDEKFAVVEEYAATNPAALRDVFASPNPAVAAYQLGKKLMEYREMQDPAAYRAKVEAEVRQKLEAEYAQRLQQQQADAAKAGAIPPDLTTSAGNSKTPARNNDVFTQLFPT